MRLNPTRSIKASLCVVIVLLATGFYSEVVFGQSVLPGILQAEPSLVTYQGDIPDDLLNLIQKAQVPIVQNARLEDDGDVQQLYRRLRTVLRDVLGTQGYFSPTITRKTPTGEFVPHLTIELKIGEPSKISSVDLRFEGAIATPEFAERRQELVDLWLLKQGEVFRQVDWAESKDALLRNLLAKDFAAASVQDSVADVSSDEHTVALQVIYQSGPVFTFGELKIQGLRRYSTDLVERFNTIEPGDRYEQEKLLNLLSDLQGATYFSSVDVKIDRNAESPAHVPIEVTLEESKPKRLGLGAGYSSNTGFRTELNYQYDNLFDRAYSLVTGVRMEQKRQSAYADLFLPPSHENVRDSLGVSTDHQSLTGVDINRSAVGVLREYTVGANELRLGVNFQLEERDTPTQNLGGTKALVASGAWTRSRVDDRLNPTRGYVWSAQTAVASESLLSDQTFLRLNSKMQRFWSPSSKDLWSARLELGTVIAGARREIPQDYLFRTGGTTSLRGFKYLDVGVLQDGVLAGGRRLMVGSVEYTRWIKGSMGASVFTDYGGVADSWGDLHPTPTVGVGLRYRTPAGPIALDIAKARDQKNIRIHFALGVAF